MLPSFSPDGSKVVFCRSDNGKSNLYLYEYDKALLQKTRLEKLTDNDGNNISPTVRDDGDVIFCSDAESKGPQICYYHAFTKQIEILTTDGYCAAPSFCEKNKQIAYTRYNNGVMQLFIYDMMTKKHSQTTFDSGNKQECTWSPCGNYLAFCIEDGIKSRIAVLNLLTAERTYLTPPNARCRYPSWSPYYTTPLIAMK